MGEVMVRVLQNSWRCGHGNERNQVQITGPNPQDPIRFNYLCDDCRGRVERLLNLVRIDEPKENAFWQWVKQHTEDDMKTS